MAFTAPKGWAAEPDGLWFYGLRHTCASLLIAQGTSVKAVQAQLGHATASITLDPCWAPVRVRAGHPRSAPGAGPGRGRGRGPAGTDPALTRFDRLGEPAGVTQFVAEAEGFEPSRELPPYTLSRRVPSTARPSLRRAV
jgi:hypothetical protein